MWDAYDGQGNKIGGELIRGQEIPEGTRRRWYCRRGKLFLFVDNCAGIFGVCGIREACLDAEGEDGRVSGWGEE